MSDRPPASFAALRRHRQFFEILVEDRRSPITIMAPHGGRIEPNSDEIARLIAGNDYNCYRFLGRAPGNNRNLRLPSHCFDEPRALALTKRSSMILTVHGCRATRPVIILGGLDRPRLVRLLHAFQALGLAAEAAPPNSPLSGKSPSNLCNRGTTGRGIQLEISRPLRDSPTARDDIARAVRQNLCR